MANFLTPDSVHLSTCLPPFVHSVMLVIDKTNSLQVTGDVTYLTVNELLPPVLHLSKPNCARKIYLVQSR
jgi:hypothetical protein